MDRKQGAEERRSGIGFWVVFSYVLFIKNYDRMLCILY